MLQKIIIWGTGQISDVVTHFIRRDASHEIVAYCIDRAWMEASVHNGLPVVAFEDIKTVYPPSEVKLLFPISFRKLNTIREDKFNKAKQMGYDFVSYISRNAICDASKIGENVIIFDGAIINPFVKIGNNCIIWSQSHIGHHSTVGDNCFIASARTAGCVKVQNNCFLGVGSVICDTLTIGDHSIIGGGVVVTKDLPSASVIASPRVQPLPITSYEIEGVLG